MAVPCRAAVLGSPIAHSLSPVLHRAAYAALGLDGWTYTAIECDETGLPGLIASLDSAGLGGRAPRGARAVLARGADPRETPGRRWAGLSLTMPLKRAVLPLLDHTEPLALQIGCANTVIFAGGQRRGY